MDLGEETSSARSTALQESARGPPKKGHQLVVSIVIVLATLVVFVAAYLLFFRTVFVIAYCDTDDCISHAYTLSAALDPSVNPCEDFHAYVCGRWQRSATHESIQDGLVRLALNNSVAELESDLWEDERASQFYHKCLKPEKSGSIRNIHLLKAFMRNSLWLVWPYEVPKSDGKLHPLLVMLRMALRWDVNFLFGVEIAYNTSSGGAVPFVKWGQLGAAWRDHLATPMSGPEYLQHILDNLGALNAPLIGATAKELQDIEKDFTSDIYGSLHSPANQTFIALNKLDDRTSVLPNSWANFFRQVFGETGDGLLLSLDNLIAFEDSRIVDSLQRLFLQHFREQAGNDTKDLFLIGLSWMFIQSHLWAVAGKPSLMFRDAAESKMKIACLEYVDSRLGLLSSVKHVTGRYKTPEIRQAVSSFVNRSKQTMDSLLRTAKWIDEDTLNGARSKIHTMTVNILPAEYFFAPKARAELYASFPDASNSVFVDVWQQYSEHYQRLQSHRHFPDVYSKRMTFHREPYTYKYLTNTVDVALVGLEPPLYYLNATLAITFAGVGYRIAREMCRSIDEQGQAVDSKGALNQWWKPVLTTEFSRRTSCDLKLSPAPARHGAPVVALLPTIPALEVAFAAYKLAVADDIRVRGAHDLRLRKLESFSDDQIFFMSFCYGLCAKREGSNGDECNVPVKHSRAFAEAFQCPLNSPMNMPEKCTYFLD
ncbi:endothelin-converting enzyme 1-like [Haemaphysalis longicornis]